MKLNKDLRVAISGKSGCGNTTVSGMLAKTLGVTLINYTFRQLAAEKGMTLAEVIEAAKTDDSYDKYVDKHQVELALERLNERNTVQLDEERKAAMVSNLLVVLCGNHDAQPVVNSGSLY